MATILYGVAGEGMGHAIRSRVVIEHLQKKHKVIVVSADRAYHYLKQFCDCREIDYFKIIYRNNKAANLLTLLNNLLRFPVILKRGWKVFFLIKNHKPDIIFTDFEPLTAYAGKIKRIPIISIDNQHIITQADHSKLSKDYWLTAWFTKIVIKLFVPKANKYFTTTFFPASSMDESVEVIKPLLRQEIIRMKPAKGKHILVYQTSTSNKDLIPTLQSIKSEQFVVYGFHKNKKEKNVQLKTANEKEFLHDLQHAEAVITNGGFTLMSEAIYLKKPVLSIPVGQQFEQIFNALHLDAWQYGMYAPKTTKKSIQAFLSKLSEYKEQLKAVPSYTNTEAFHHIDKSIEDILGKNKTKKKSNKKYKHKLSKFSN